jgi:hypothetical protein
MTNDLAALSEAATKGANPMLLECVENGVWQIRLVFGEGDDACHAMRQWADAYRAGRLVQIDPEGMRERAIDAVNERWGKTICTADALVDAAIAAILGDAA